MDTFVIYPGDFENEIESDGQCSLIGVDCPVCGLWGNVGISYPSVDCSEMVELGKDVNRHFYFRGSRIPKSMTIEEYKELKSRLLPVLGQDRPVEPATRLGPMKGKALGEFGDFVWASEWTPLVRESVFQNMLDSGIRVTGARAELDFGRVHEPLIELEVRPTARLTPLSGFRICDDCGRVDLYGRKIVDVASLDTLIPVQRVFEVSNVIVVNRIFAEFIRDENLSNIKIGPLITS